MCKSAPIPRIGAVCSTRDEAQRGHNRDRGGRRNCPTSSTFVHRFRVRLEVDRVAARRVATIDPVPASVAGASSDGGFVYMISDDGA
jgi:hypothetical protein